MTNDPVESFDDHVITSSNRTARDVQLREWFEFSLDNYRLGFVECDCSFRLVTFPTMRGEPRLDGCNRAERIKQQCIRRDLQVEINEAVDQDARDAENCGE